MQRQRIKKESLLSKKVERMRPSGIRAFFDLVLGKKDVISLGVGEPDFVTPWQIREAGIFSLEQGFTSYTSNKGLYKLRCTLARYIKERCGLSYSPEDEILITVGVSEALDLCMRALLNPGEKVIIPLPSYVSYAPLVDLAGGVPVYVDTTANQFKLSVDLLRRCFQKGIKAVVLNYPNNPTGVSYTQRELAQLNEFFLAHNIFVISDEVYADLTYDFEHTHFSTLKGAWENTLYLNGFSKAYAMTGWRVGFACGPAWLIEAMTKIHQYTIMCVSITSQMAACEALISGRKAVEQMRREYKRRREFVVAELNRLGLPCQKGAGAFYAFASIKNTGMKALEFATALLQEENVAVVPGTAFGPARRIDENRKSSLFDDYVRISYATAFNQLKEALTRIKRFLERRGIYGKIN